MILRYSELKFSFRFLDSVHKYVAKFTQRLIFPTLLIVACIVPTKNLNTERKKMNYIKLEYLQE